MWRVVTLLVIALTAFQAEAIPVAGEAKHASIKRRQLATNPDVVVKDALGADAGSNTLPQTEGIGRAVTSNSRKNRFNLNY
jgi:hypothetical protein